MGLHLNFEISLPGSTPESVVVERVSALRERALALPFKHVSELVRLTEYALAGPWPQLKGLAFERLEDVVHISAALAREELFRRSLGVVPDLDAEPTHVVVPVNIPTVAIGFALGPGRGCEPAAFGVAGLTGADNASLPWLWHCSCNTQYASVVSTEHLLCCHGSLVALLDHAVSLGFEVVVRDETGYWESRDATQLVDAVADMNRIVARFAGKFNDGVRETGADSRQVRGAIFVHPDFERLESDG